MNSLEEGSSPAVPASLSTTSVPRTETYLLLCPTHRDDRELALLARNGLRFIRHDYASIALEQMVAPSSSELLPIPNVIEEIDRILESVSRETITGVISTDDYPGISLACAVAETLRLPGTAPGVNLLCQHKYYARLAHQALVPASTPAFALIDVDRPAKLPAKISLPAFVKPVKSFFSVGASRLSSLDQLRTIQEKWAGLPAFFEPFAQLLKRYEGLSVGRSFLLVEGLLQGVQVTLEGYAYGREIHVLGVIDSVMFPGTIAFERFEYPSLLPASVQNRMAAIATSVMRGIGFRNAMFNIEFMYDPTTEAVSIIEINPRMASQFADLYEKVDGFNSYTILLDLAAGREPHPLRGKGSHQVAASCVLRSFRDMQTLGLPTLRELDDLNLRHPDVRVETLASVGRWLSEEMQDGSSFRYGIVNLGGRDRQEILEKLQDCTRRLGFRFAAASPARAGRTGDF